MFSGTESAVDGIFAVCASIEVDFRDGFLLISLRYSRGCLVKTANGTSEGVLVLAMELYLLHSLLCRPFAFGHH